VLGNAAEGSSQLGGVDPGIGIGAVHEVLDLGRGVADDPECVGQGDRVVDRRRVVGDDLEDDVRAIGEDELSSSRATDMSITTTS
jgi:hypothetical protein